MDVTKRKIMNERNLAGNIKEISGRSVASNKFIFPAPNFPIMTRNDEIRHM